MEFSIFKDKLFKKAKEEGFTDCEIYYTDGENISISVYDYEVEKYNIDKYRGLSFRGLINGKMGYSYTEILDEEALNMLIKNAKEGALFIENTDLQFIYDGDESYEEVKTYSEKLENIDPSKLIEIAIDLERQTRELSDKVINLNGCKITYSTSSNLIVNTKNLNLSKKSNLLMAYVIPVIKDNNQKQDGIGYQIVEDINDIDTKKIASDAVNEAFSKIGAKSIKSGDYKTIINNEAMSSLLKAFSDVFSAESAQRGMSLLKDKEGNIIASNFLNIVDNPLLNNGLASTPFDDEGVSTYKKYIIKDGKLVTLLHNLKTANKANTKTTGNGFKSSYSSVVSVSPTNLYIESGKKTFEELLYGIKEGVIVTDFAGLHSGTNSITGDFSLAAKGYFIENDKKSYPIEQITVAGNFFELIKNIEDIANDLVFPLSSIGSPSIKIKSLSIAGK